MAFDETGLDVALTAILEHGLPTVPGADDLSVTLLGGRDADTVVCTGSFAVLLDQWQYEQGEGPCLEAAAYGATISAVDLRTETRWPSWSRRAVDLGAASCLAIGLRLPQGVPGCLNLYAHRLAAFGPDAEIVAQGVAGDITVVLATIDGDDRDVLSRHRRTTTQHRAMIDQARHRLITRRHCSAEKAFALLIRQAYRGHQPLHEAAAAVMHGK